ncbi:MAG: DNA polymerase III subunit beta [Deltaproteobacteria bacterium]|nr:DNA polymerase III subunit beta [Deltaproteobacteria bacterium]
MQVHIEQEVLMKGVNHTLGVVDKKGTLPILSHCLIQTNGSGLIVSATDLETSFRGFYPAEVLEPGTFTVQAHALHSLAKDLPKGRVEIRGDDRQVKLEVGESRYKFNTLPADQYPPIPEIGEEGLVEVEAGLLLELIDKTVFSVGDDLQYHLSGVFWERVEHEGEAWLRLVSTDGHRLSLAERPLPEVERLELGEGVLVPAKAVREIRRFVDGYGREGGVRVGVRNKALCLKAGDKELSVRLLDKKFPEYRRIIPEEFRHTFTFNRQELAAVLKRISLLTQGPFRGVIFTFSDGAAEIAHENPEVGAGRETAAILETAGDLAEPLQIGFNARYLLEPLQVMKSEQAVLSVNDPDRPCRIMDPNDPHCYSLVMPMSM